MNDDSDKWYFAYGANMHPDVFISRRRMRPQARDKAVIEGYQLVFDHPGLPFIEPAFANVREAAGGKCWGILWRISAEDFERLDILEGGGAYERVLVKAQSDLYGVVEAYVYVAHRTLEGLRPSRRYLEILLAGAKRGWLPAEYIDKIRRTPAYDLPLLKTISPYVMRLTERIFEAGIDLKKPIDLYWNALERRRKR